MSRVRAVLWDFGGVRLVSGSRSLVVGLGVDGPGSATLTAYADAADRGVTDVTKAWGKDWQRRVLVVAGEGHAQASGRPEGARPAATGSTIWAFEVAQSSAGAARSSGAAAGEPGSA